jgi:hypothetical protein
MTKGGLATMDRNVKDNSKKNFYDEYKQSESFPEKKPRTPGFAEIYAKANSQYYQRQDSPLTSPEYGSPLTSPEYNEIKLKQNIPHHWKFNHENPSYALMFCHKYRADIEKAIKDL